MNVMRLMRIVAATSASWSIGWAASTPARPAGVARHSRTTAECPVASGDTLQYRESLLDSIAVQGARGPQGIETGSEGILIVSLTPAGGVAFYASLSPAGGGTGDVAQRARVQATAVHGQFRFAAGDCGFGQAVSVPTFDPSIGASAELPYHLDGFLVAPPQGMALVPGARWEDTLTRSDSVPERRSASILRRFVVTGDTTFRGLPAVIVATQAQGTVLRTDAGHSVSIVLSRESSGRAIVTRASHLMVSRSDTTRMRISADIGDQHMDERSATSVWSLVLICGS
jgi:hypothetical protein